MKSCGARRPTSTAPSPTIPRIIAAWTEFANTLRNDSRTPRALRELVILRGAQLCASEYEWAQHLRMARKAGVREAQIAALADWRASSEFDAKEKAALMLAEAVTEGRVSDEVHREAMRHFDHHDYVELAVTAGFYAMVARMLDAMAVELEPDVPRLLAEAALKSYRYYDFVMAAFVTVLICSNLIGAGEEGDGRTCRCSARSRSAPACCSSRSRTSSATSSPRSTATRARRRVIWAGFAALAFASFMAWVVVACRRRRFMKTTRQAYEGAFGNSWRIALGSMIAYFCGSSSTRSCWRR